MVRQYGVSRILAVGLPLAGNGKFCSVKAKLRLRLFGIHPRESSYGSSIRRSRILAVGLPLAGNGKFPSKKTCGHFFEILFNAKTTFSCVSGIK